MDIREKEPSPKKVYVEPTLEAREPVDEVVWGQLSTTTSGRFEK